MRDLYEAASQAVGGMAEASHKQLIYLLAIINRRKLLRRLENEKKIVAIHVSNATRNIYQLNYRIAWFFSGFGLNVDRE